MSAQYTPEEKLDYLLGQFRALSATVGVLVGVRPDAQRLLKEINSLLARLESLAVGEELSDAHGDGIADFQTKLAETVATFQANRV